MGDEVSTSLSLCSEFDGGIDFVEAEADMAVYVTRIAL